MTEKMAGTNSCRLLWGGVRLIEMSKKMTEIWQRSTLYVHSRQVTF